MLCCRFARSSHQTLTCVDSHHLGLTWYAQPNHLCQHRVSAVKLWKEHMLLAIIPAQWHALQVAFGPVARELVVYRHKSPNCSFHGEPPADWVPPKAGAFDRCCLLCFLHQLHSGSIQCRLKAPCTFPGIVVLLDCSCFPTHCSPLALLYIHTVSMIQAVLAAEWVAACKCIIWVSFTLSRSSMYAAVTSGRCSGSP